MSSIHVTKENEHLIGRRAVLTKPVAWIGVDESEEGIVYESIHGKISNEFSVNSLPAIPSGATGTICSCKDYSRAVEKSYEWVPAIKTAIPERAEEIKAAMQRIHGTHYYERKIFYDGKIPGEGWEPESNLVYLVIRFDSHKPTRSDLCFAVSDTMIANGTIEIEGEG